MATAAHAAATQQAPSSRYLEDTAEIRQLFVVLRDQRAKLTLRFQTPRTSVTASLLDVTDDDLLIEDIQPRSGLKLLRDGHTFALSCRSEGQYALAENNRVHRAEAERGLPYFHVKLPASLLYQQRRRHARVSLALSVQAHGARLILDRQNPAHADIVDLSAGGCMARFKGRFTPELAEGELLRDCGLQIRDQLELRSDVQVRHYHYDKRTNRSLCGFEFTAMTVTDRRRLEQFVASCHRNAQNTTPTG